MIRRQVEAERRGLPLRREGLSAEEVAALRKRFGSNRIIERSGRSWTETAADTLRDPMLWFLLVTGALFAAVGELTEALILLVAIIPVAGMDAFLHWRTQASTAGLGSLLATRARVVRDGRWVQIPAEELVPGDRVRVQGNEPFPADGVILAGEELKAEESALTGEAFPVVKRPLPPGRLPGPAPVAEEHWGLAGTRLLTGQAELAVVYTGGSTLYGEIVRSAAAGASGRTPLQAAVANLVTVLLVAAAILCLILAWVRWEQGFGVLDALLSALTLAVAALPEEFPIILTFFLGVGVYRLARRQALVRRAVAVENIGRISCICSDKTGTLTEGRLTLAHLFPAAGFDEPTLREVAARASRAESGDPLDAAILQGRESPPPPVALFPFTEDRKRETAVVDTGQRLEAFVKGAPERVLAGCDLSAEERERWWRRVIEVSAAGHRVIACARRALDREWAGGEPDRGFRLAGLLAFEDPVREGVPAAVSNCRAAGIHVLMITGDHPATAAAVAREIGLGGGQPRVIEADALEAAMAEGGLDPLAVDVVARAIPSQKLALVQHLKAAGEIVAVTGDGVNDVPALQAADIGVAMGGRGTQSAREAAAIVLLDDNFRSIVRAVIEGQQLFRNLRLGFAYLLMIHIPLVISATLIPLAGYPLLYLPVHIVWLELIIHPTAILVFQELPTGERIERQQRPVRVRFFGGREWLTLTAAGLLITLIVVVGYDRSLGANGDVPHARAMAIAALAFASAALTVGLSALRGRMSKWVVGLTLLSTLLLIQLPSLSQLLHLAPLHRQEWLMALAAGLLAAVPAFLLRRRLPAAGRERSVD